MLTHIHIRHFVIVKSLSLDFQSGLHVLTGETGAGKSIWVDAIAIGLGARADAHIIYPGEQSCDITLCFDLTQLPTATNWLVTNDLAHEGECIIRRVIDRSKASRTTINGTPVSQQQVRALGELLLCIHGQHQHHQLLKSIHQMALLDAFGQHDALLAKIQTTFYAWQTLERERQELSTKSANKSADLSLWRYQLEELQNLHLQDNVYENLFSEYQQLHHAKSFMTQLHEALSFLTNDEQPAAGDYLQKALHTLQGIPTDNAKIQEVATLLQTASIHCEEAIDTLSHYCENVDYQLDRIEHIEKQLSQIQDIARKHHVDPSELVEIEKSLAQKIEMLEKADENLAALVEKQKIYIAHYQETAKQLSQHRQKAADLLQKYITEQMQLLGMHGGRFVVRLQPRNTQIHPDGEEHIQFLIATNPEQTPHMLSEIVSGGELSRLSLITQVLNAQQKNMPTLIFDEVDVGIGGKTADIIGRLLRQLSAKSQVLCVTHLPQVAAAGHHHFKAEKVTDGKHTTTTITLLNTKERATELARMLSGAKITENSVLHASELLEAIQEN